MLNPGELETLLLNINTVGIDVKKAETFFQAASLTLALLVLSGCGTPSAKNFHGSWKPVNKFQETPTEIPLSKAYTYYASPLDGTLKTMLTRWSKDTGIPLAYQISSDYTLITRVSGIRTPDITAAASQLSAIYAPESISITANPQQIRVEIASPATNALAPASNTGSPHRNNK